MSDTDTVIRMLCLCYRYDLSGYEFCRQFPNSVLAEDFNGIGPEWFPEKLREFIDALEDDLLPAAFVHDVRWSHSDGTLLAFSASNEELRENCKRIAFGKYSWWDPRRYLRWRTGVVFARLCNAFGLSAYNAAYERANPQEAKQI